VPARGAAFLQVRGLRCAGFLPRQRARERPSDRRDGALDALDEDLFGCFVASFFFFAPPFFRFAVWKMEVVVDSGGEGDWKMEEAAELVVEARAPGKVILSGEHAVVHGTAAVAAALGLYSTARIRHRPLSPGEALSVSRCSPLCLVFFLPLAAVAAAPVAHIVCCRVLLLFSACIKVFVKRSRSRRRGTMN